MKRNNISEEQLAAIIDKQPDINIEAFLQSEVSMDDFEVMNATKRALKLERKPKRFNFPDWRQVADSPQISRPMYSNLAMAGFLGDEATEEDEENELDDSSLKKK